MFCLESGLHRRFWSRHVLHREPQEFGEGLKQIRACDGSVPPASHRPLRESQRTQFGFAAVNFARFFQRRRGDTNGTVWSFRRR